MIDCLQLIKCRVCLISNRYLACHGRPLISNESHGQSSSLGDGDHAMSAITEDYLPDKDPSTFLRGRVLPEGKIFP
jgi:hypothetical protein